jgi:hypothetical protein
MHTEVSVNKARQPVGCQHERVDLGAALPVGPVIGVVLPDEHLPRRVDALAVERLPSGGSCGS